MRLKFELDMYGYASLTARKRVVNGNNLTLDYLAGTFPVYEYPELSTFYRATYLRRGLHFKRKI